MIKVSKCSHRQTHTHTHTHTNTHTHAQNDTQVRLKNADTPALGKNKRESQLCYSTSTKSALGVKLYKVVEVRGVE